MPGLVRHIPRIGSEVTVDLTVPGALQIRPGEVEVEVVVVVVVVVLVVVVVVVVVIAVVVVVVVVVEVVVVVTAALVVVVVVPPAQLISEKYSPEVELGV